VSDESTVHRGRCGILRCTAYADGALLLQHLPNPRDPAGDPIPWYVAVCSTHKAMADAGLPWRYEPDPIVRGRGKIVMGEDLDSGGIYITSVTVLPQHADDVYSDGSHGVTVQAERTRGDGTVEPLTLYLSEDLIKKLARRWVR
jgi:hypothetical protein